MKRIIEFMFCKNLKYLFIWLLLVGSGFISSCTVDPIFQNEDQAIEDSEKGDVLTVKITLDKLGGISTKAENDPLTEIENYIDPEKIRVLVFDEDDKFLFESKNRWVKQLNPGIDHSAWSVSIPLYSSGNDRGKYDWEWDKIRKKLISGNFKVAILTNRPDKEWNFGILARDENGNDIEGDYVVPNGWFLNNGPDWDKTNSVVYSGPGGEIKDVFDLHHSQYDPIYHGKNYYTTDGAFAGNHNFYSCVTEGSAERPFMGATSSWVDWGIGDNVRDDQGWKFRIAQMPSQSHPIPMYGIQEFGALSEWKEGTTINLGDKPISLLRSVVRLELLVPKNSVAHVLLFYSNIYARCEPMDVWTPTDQLWTANERHSQDCEWNLVKEFGRMTQINVPNDDDIEFKSNTQASIDGSKEHYQQRLSWLYGIWRKKKDWSFNRESGATININKYFDDKYGNYEDNRFVRIFNPCIQRNTAVYIKKHEGFNDGYDHYIVYTGERNINDPSNLGQIGNTGGGNPTVIYWTLIDNTEKFVENSTKTEKRGYFSTYSLPIVDYSTANLSSVTKQGFVFANDIPQNGENGVPLFQNTKSSTGMGEYLKALQNGNTLSKNNWPLPLLRNHIYRLTLTGTKSADGIPFSVHLEEKHTRDINFK